MKKESSGKKAIFRSRFLLVIMLLSVSIIQTAAQVSTEFTYQGKLTVSGAPANGNFDLRITLENIDGFSLGKPNELLGTTVTNGIFTVSLDFGTEFFDQNDRYLKIEVRQSSPKPDDYTELSPRQKLTPAPTAFFSRNSLFAVESGNSTNSQNSLNSQTLGGISADGFIQNSTTPQSGANFNITGSGAAGGTLSGNAVNTETQYNIGGSRILGTFGSSLYVGLNVGGNSTGNFNNFFGILTGSVNTTGNSNSFFGASAGFNNTTGSNNNFFGRLAGGSNTTGGSNAFYGASAGFSNTTASNNSFYGVTAGFSNVTGEQNSYFGTGSGFGSTNNGNSFFGYQSGYNATGGGNNFFGDQAGYRTTGGFNSFFGYSSGSSNTSGAFNNFFGYQAGGLNTSGSENDFFGHGAGYSNRTGVNNNFYGTNAGGLNDVGSNNSFFGSGSGANSDGGNNTFVGVNSGFNNIIGSSNTFIGSGAGNTLGNNISFSTAIGYNAAVSTDHTIVLGTSGERVIAAGTMRVASIPLIASTRQVCANAAGDLLQCGASTLRLKDNVQPFFNGLNLIRQFNPISFNWKDGSGYDIGLAAEDVNKIDPFFAFKNDQGEVQGVRYERLNILLINSVKEQQTQIETQQKTIERQQKQLDALTKLVCSQNPQAEICAEVK